MTDELKPCPFCGGIAVVKCISDISRPGTDDWWVSCSICRVERPSTRKSEIVGTRDEAIAAWNRRAYPPAPIDDIHEMWMLYRSELDFRPDARAIIERVRLWLERVREG